MKGKFYENGFSTPAIPTQRESLHDSNTTTTTTTHQSPVPFSTASYLSFYRHKKNAGSCLECISVLWKLNQSINDNYILKNYASLVAQSIKNLPAGQETRVRSLGSGGSPGEGNPLHYPCLENPMDRRAWWAAVHRVAKSQARLSD